MTWDEALIAIESRAAAHDLSGEWPADDLRELAACGATAWAVQDKFGGGDLSALDLHLKYEQLAAASVSTALILTQRDSAIGLIESSEGPSAAAIRKTLLPALAAGNLFATVGIAQLTTSRQGGAPALVAVLEEEGYRLNGLIPWSTGAAHGFIVVGAVLESGGQILCLLLATDAGVSVGQPMPLVALRCTETAAVTCENVFVGRDRILRTPTPQVLGRRPRNLPHGQSFLALGLCRAGLNLIAQHDSDRAREAHRRSDEQLAAIREEAIGLAVPSRYDEATRKAPALRGRCNDLALRITHTAIAIYKGAALLADHPAQRLAREAMFLLVWSCPNPVIDCTVDLLTNG